ncbi:protein N-terminal asparagine amidohydrolase isoform X2 [Juglans microcarpa x Juglans regia]|uniref:protein N-terminal asparagine amidohydrolase isoform X2 n=1 Tax=Juglans microcarpa x Juglans regia TaxID=2249226 RepID=UPI001B7E0810|nr:protein N-terminal asparagine amidohydrolase isoform X2 [Juglans microcarpa x Juglans regia]XP_040992559.1 protein N-terminal asparagine amidohydrolase isoform X2 [Juglans microcarpa x Juglans regia]
MDTDLCHLVGESHTLMSPKSKFVGTDEATTCVGLVIHNRKNGITSVAHMDSPDIVDMGLFQMLLLVVDHNLDAELEVHLVGGFEDVSPNFLKSCTRSESDAKLEGYSYPLCAKIFETLCTRREKFHIQTAFILGHNTRRDSEGNAFPIFNGLAVETSTGSVIPACFDGARCPDEIVRRIRVTASYEDCSWNGKLLDTYDTRTDQFRIASCCWTSRQRYIALTRRHLTDSEILLTCSTSPSAEGPDFVDNLRRQCEYLIKYPDWRETFPLKQPRVFERTSDGEWKRC